MKFLWVILKNLPLFLRLGLEFWKIVHESHKEPEKGVKPAVVAVPVMPPITPAPTAPVIVDSEPWDFPPYHGDYEAYAADVKRMQEIAKGE